MRPYQAKLGISQIRHLDLDLEIDSLNLDDYLPLDESGETTKADRNIVGFSVLVLPMAVFEGFVADAKLSVKSLSSGGMMLDDVVVDVKSDQDQGGY